MPEKSLDNLSPDCRACYEAGVAAVARQDWDEALRIFNDILVQEPGFYAGRESLRAAQLKRTEASGFFKRVFERFRMRPLLAEAEVCVHVSPLKAIHAAERVLNHDPHNSLAHTVLAKAALTADLPHTALLSLEVLHQHSPENRAVALMLAKDMARVGRMPKASLIFAWLLRNHPDDPGVHRALEQLHAHPAQSDQSQLSGGNGACSSTPKNPPEATDLRPEPRSVTRGQTLESEIAKYEALLPHCPRNGKVLTTLAELYSRKSDFAGALRCYQSALAIEGRSDDKLERAIAETTLKQFDRALAQLDPLAPDYAEQSARLRTERLHCQLNECRRQVEKCPTDLEARFDLGQCYFETGLISEAISEFQQAEAFPARRIQSLIYVGRCLAGRRMYGAAVETLQQALTGNTASSAEKKELLYALGCVLEAAGRRKEALAHFKQLHQADAAYKDVATKIETSCDTPQSPRSPTLKEAMHPVDAHWEKRLHSCAT